MGAPPPRLRIRQRIAADDGCRRLSPGDTVERQSRGPAGRVRRIVQLENRRPKGSWVRIPPSPPHESGTQAASPSSTGNESGNESSGECPLEGRDGLPVVPVADLGVVP